MDRRKCIISSHPLSSKFSHVMDALCVSSPRDGLSVSKSVHRSSGVAGFGPPISVEVGPPVSSPPTGVSSPWVSPLVSKKVSCDATISNSHVEPYTSAPPGVASAQLQLLLEFLPMTSKLESILLVVNQHLRHLLRSR
ncbi:BnaA06g17260D [Brassica napus]|uniref:BnaA06g17260D protein n=1 Tax=Brassica napus TaxID=3708 RepID=A0A078HGP7_BRANA|nr:BnaA06g17260D [Brassica napus]